MDARVTGEVTKHWDTMLEVELRVLEDVHRSRVGRPCRLVDVGCGSKGILGRKLGRLTALQALSIGIDIDSEALTKNYDIRSPVCASCYSLPLRSNSIDIIVCRWMLEHLEYPERAMSEMARVLKTHGVLYLKTPNLWNYTMLLSWATSTGVHNFFRSLTGADDNIPTFYRANTEGKLTRLANANGFAVRRLELVSYSYMYYAFNKELFVTMRSLSKVVGKVTSRMRQTILCVFEKVHDAPDAMSRGGDVR